MNKYKLTKKVRVSDPSDIFDDELCRLLKRWRKRK